MPIIPKTQLPESTGAVPHYARQNMISPDWNVGNSLGSGIAEGIKGIADAGYKIAGIYAKKQKEQEDAEKELQDAQDRMMVQKLQTDYTLATNAFLQQASENPGDYAKMDMTAQRNVIDILSRQQEDFDKIQDVKYRQSLDCWRALHGAEYQAKVHDIANQGMISEYRTQVASDMDALCNAGQFDEADAMLSEVKQGVFRPDEIQKLKEQVGTSRAVATVRADASWDSVGPEETLDILKDAEVCRDYYGEIPESVRHNLIAECSQMVSDRKGELLDDLNNRMVVKGERMTDEEIKQFVEDPANHVPKEIAPKLVTIVRNINAAEKKSYGTGTGRAVQLYDGDDGKKHTFKEIYASDLGKCNGRFPTDLMERGKKVEEFKEEFFEKYSEMGKLKEYGVLLKTMEANAYPDVSRQNEPLMWYFRDKYGDYKSGFDGKKIEDGFFESYDPDNRWYRNNRGNDKDIIDMNERLFEAEMVKYITTTPNISEDDIDAMAKKMGEHFHYTSVDMLVNAHQERARLANPSFDQKKSPTAGE